MRLDPVVIRKGGISWRYLEQDLGCVIFIREADALHYKEIWLPGNKLRNRDAQVPMKQFVLITEIKKETMDVEWWMDQTNTEITTQIFDTFSGAKIQSRKRVKDACNRCDFFRWKETDTFLLLTILRIVMMIVFTISITVN